MRSLSPSLSYFSFRIYFYFDFPVSSFLIANEALTTKNSLRAPNRFEDYNSHTHEYFLICMLNRIIIRFDCAWALENSKTITIKYGFVCAIDMSSSVWVCEPCHTAPENNKITFVKINTLHTHIHAARTIINTIKTQYDIKDWRRRRRRRRRQTIMDTNHFERFAKRFACVSAFQFRCEFNYRMND